MTKEQLFGFVNRWYGWAQNEGSTDEEDAQALLEVKALLTAEPRDDWRPIETAPRDGTWILLRGRNAADRPMVPVVAAWRPLACKHNGWADSGTFKPVDDLAIEWAPVNWSAENRNGDV